MAWIAWGLDPTHLVAKIGYQGICWYVPAGNATLRSECKLKESPHGASSQYHEWSKLYSFQRADACIGPPFWACSSAGRTSALQAEGRGFESRLVHLRYLANLQIFNLLFIRSISVVFNNFMSRKLAQKIVSHSDFLVLSAAGQATSEQTRGQWRRCTIRGLSPKCVFLWSAGEWFSGSQLVLRASYASVAQLADAIGSNPMNYGFESHQKYGG